jgi:hypothetical protein
MPRRCAAGGDAAASAILHARAADIVRRLRPDNYGHFAQLFCSSVLQARAAYTLRLMLSVRAFVQHLATSNVFRYPLNPRSQAAATGETVMDEKLSRVAAEDPTRLLRLNQRMQIAARGTQPQRPSSRASSPRSGFHNGSSKQAAVTYSQGKSSCTLDAAAVLESAVYAKGQW